jgi:hypothetical protein
MSLPKCRRKENVKRETIDQSSLIIWPSISFARLLAAMARYKRSANRGRRKLLVLFLLLIVPFGKLKQTGYKAYKSKRSYELAYDTLSLQASPPHDCSVLALHYNHDPDLEGYREVGAALS